MSIFCMWFGLDPGDWHDGTHAEAVATVPHGCPAVIRVVGTTAHPGAVATVPHGCLALIRAIGTTDGFQQRFLPSGTPDRHAIDRGYARRTAALRGAAGSRRYREGCRHNGLLEIAPRFGAAPAASRTCRVGWLPGMGHALSVNYYWHMLAVHKGAAYNAQYTMERIQ
jgi:hypothetical protein